MTTYACIIGHSTYPAALLLRGEAGWALPAVDIGDEWFPYAPHLVASLIHEQLLLRVTVLRHIRDDELHIGELENQDPLWVPPPHARWVKYVELDDLVFIVPEQRIVLEAWFAEALGGDVPHQRMPWQRPGWYAQAIDWIAAELARLGYTSSGQPEQLHAAWEWSCVMRVPTETGNLYFKADYAKPPSEVDVILMLRERWPRHVPTVVAADTVRRWILMRDFGSESLDGKSVSAWEQAVRLFAQIQVDCVSDATHWLQIGCPDRRLETLPGHLETLLGDGDAVGLGRKDGIDEATIAQLRLLMPQARQLFQKLANYGVPATVVQQDFRHGNIACVGDTFVYFDWSDTVVSHPFFAFNTFLDFLPSGDVRGVEKPDATRDETALIHRLRDAYLEPWQAYCPAEHLVEAFELSRQLHPLYQKVRLYRELPYLEVGSPWDNILTNFVPVQLQEMIINATKPHGAGCD